MSTYKRMNGEQPLPADLLELEAELAAMRPREAAFERDRILFEAGRASVAAPRGRFVWPAVSAVMTTVAACFGTMLLLQPPPEVVERVRIVEVQRSVPVEQPIHEMAADHVNVKPMQPSDGIPALAKAEPLKRSAAIVPRAGADFRLFEHLLGQPLHPVGTGPTESSEDDAEILSPRSLPKLLKVTPAIRRQNV